MLYTCPEPAGPPHQPRLMLSPTRRVLPCPFPAQADRFSPKPSMGPSRLSFHIKMLPRDDRPASGGPVALSRYEHPRRPVPACPCGAEHQGGPCRCPGVAGGRETPEQHASSRQSRTNSPQRTARPARAGGQPGPGCMSAWVPSAAPGVPTELLILQDSPLQQSASPEFSRMSIYVYRGCPAWKGREGPGRGGRGGRGGLQGSLSPAPGSLGLLLGSVPRPALRDPCKSRGSLCLFFFFNSLFRFIFCKNLILNSLDAIFFILSIDSSWKRRTRNALHVANAAGSRLQEGSGATAGRTVTPPTPSRTPCPPGAQRPQPPAFPGGQGSQLSAAVRGS